MKTFLSRREAIFMTVFFGALFGLGVHCFDRVAEHARAGQEHDYVDSLQTQHEVLIKRVEKLQKATGCA